MSSTSRSTPSHIDALRVVYDRKQRSTEFQEEESILRDLIPRLQEALDPVYDLGEPFSLGSTATLWKVHDRSLKKERALKLPRPRQSKMSDIISVVRGERDKLASLNHQNLIKVYFAKEVTIGDYIFPFYVMEYLAGVQDLDKFILSNLGSLSGDEIAGYFHDVLAGLSYLHHQGVMHCDIKPANLLIAPGTGVLIADLGYAKYLPVLPQPDGSLTEVVYTRAYAHPDLRRRVTRSSDPDANRSPIPQSDLRPAFDLFALGRTIQETLETIRQADALASRVPVPFTQYQWLYLTYVAKRLLDGQMDPQRSSTDPLTSDVIPGVPSVAMQDLKYGTAEDALDDLQKLLHLYDLEGVVPELNPNISTYIRVPHANVPMTTRVKGVIDHPSFRRLGQVTQLGFVSWVYPGATHTRLEHVLGTFAQCCNYVRALWYDERSCFFQCAMTERHLKLVLLAALLHDIAQYPMAHELTEVASEFGHERFTAHMLLMVDREEGVSLREIVEAEWQVSVEDLLHVLEPNEASPYRLRLLHSVVSGPLDCDKLDYLKRDATHVGVSFGEAIDDQRLLRNLTTVFGVERSAGNTVVVAEIGVGEKALAVAEALVRTRKDMFRQVYWHHTVRALKAMLAFVVRDVLVRVSAAGHEEAFWPAFVGMAFSGEWRASREPVDSFSAVKPASDGESEIAGTDQQHSFVRGLLPTDDDLLSFFREYAGDDAREVVDAIRRRRLYRRLAVLSAAQQEIPYANIYAPFRTYRLDGKPKDIEDARAKWEAKLVDKANEALNGATGFTPARRDRVGKLLTNLRPLILVDVPIKAVTKGRKENLMWFVPEDAVGVHARERGEEPRMEKAKLDLDQEHFDREVGKIRVFAHPSVQEDLAALLTDSDIFGIVSA